MSKCKVCRQPFKKLSISHKVDSPECAIIFAAQERAKKERKEHAKLKVAMRSKRDWLKLAQVAFNQWIRKRDEGKPCISCGRFHEGQHHAGHYLSVGARPELRFEEKNANLQCSACNNYLSGNIVLYRKNLIERIGLENVEWLEGYHPPNKYTSEQLQAIIKLYKAKLKE
jgi:hypothetical protein